MGCHGLLGKLRLYFPNLRGISAFQPDGRMAMRPFLVLLFTDGLLLTSFITAVSLSTMTFYHIHINTMVSDNYRRAQRTVLIALCAQVILIKWLLVAKHEDSFRHQFLCFVYTSHTWIRWTHHFLMLTTSFLLRSQLHSYLPFPCGTQ